MDAHTDTWNWRLGYSDSRIRLQAWKHLFLYFSVQGKPTARLCWHATWHSSCCFHLVLYRCLLLFEPSGPRSPSHVHVDSGDRGCSGRGGFSAVSEINKGTTLKPNLDAKTIFYSVYRVLSPDLLWSQVAAIIYIVELLCNQYMSYYLVSGPLMWALFIFYIVFHFHIMWA